MVSSLMRLTKKMNLLPARVMRSRRPAFPIIKSPVGGYIGVSPCPGIHGDLSGDIEQIEQWGPSVVVSLVETHELKKAGAEHIGEILREKRIDWFHMPIVDCDIPETDVRSVWLDLKPLVRYRLSHKKDRILLHCWAGCGRTGMIAARLLMECGMTAEEAVSHVRSVKPDAIDTFAQIKWLNTPSW